MKPLLLLAVVVMSFCLSGNRSFGQLQITTSNSAAALAQKIAGPGVTVSNATLTGGSNAKGFFVNQGNTQIGIDSGVVLTSGRAKTTGLLIGVDGNGTLPASTVDVNNSNNFPGDLNLANAIGIPLSSAFDACILEFDFIPIGDTISFKYVFSSEEYRPSFVCQFNDAFAFFISGPGITALKNIALVPGTNTPVSIFNVNNVKDPPNPLCPNNVQYYVDNSNNTFFTHEGHTTVLTATSGVQPCQTYHLKMVIMDVGDDLFDSGVFLEAGSLRSDPLQIDNHIQLNEFNKPYLAEGCSPGSIHVTRNRKKSYSQTFNLQFSGTAINGVDVAAMPSSVTIPANDSVVAIPIVAIADFVPENNEKLKIYILNSCSSFFSDSIEIELRDIDMLAVTPADSIHICRNGSIQLQVQNGYANYSWTNSFTLSDADIANPVAVPISPNTNYVCTATSGNCTARDSVLVKWKTIEIRSKTDVQCHNGTSGSITVAGTDWEGMVGFALNNGTYQSSGTFSGLPAGNYSVKVKDASGCVDSIQVELLQVFPDLTVAASITAATCSLAPDGKINVSASGGNGAYTYSSNGTMFQNGNTLIVPDGTYTVHVKDGNGCIAVSPGIIVPKINDLAVDAGPDMYICEGTSHIINASTNLAANINWTPAVSLNNANTLTPVTSTVQTTKYFINAKYGSCSRIDSVTINVRPAPIPDAGSDETICYGITAQLNGSGGEEYNWGSNPTFISGTDISNPVVKPSATTSYFLHVKDSHGCNSLQPDEMRVIVTPAVHIFAGRDTIVATNQPLQLHAIETNNSGVRKWEWSGTRFLDDPFIASPIATFTSPASSASFEYIYTVTGSTSEGCQGSDEIKIKVYNGPEIYVPSAFTPNYDGKNDILMAFPVGIKEFRYFRVFNRWGQMVFNTPISSKGWDGRIEGNKQAPGVFVWIAEGIDYMGNLVTRRGTITLIR